MAFRRVGLFAGGLFAGGLFAGMLFGPQPAQSAPLGRSWRSGMPLEKPHAPHIKTPRQAQLEALILGMFGP